MAVQLRTPDSCPYRLPLAGDRTGSTPTPHYCNLALGLTGTAFESRCAVTTEECSVCCHYGLPTREAPNPLVASVLYKAASKIANEGGVPGCDVNKAREVMTFAGKFLLVLPRKGNPGPRQLRDVEQPLRQGPCKHLGMQIGERSCQSCRGNVRLKVFHCDHPDHKDTTVKDCQNCDDYEAGGRQHIVQHWAVAVTAAPSCAGSVRASIRSLRHAGWSGRMYLFAGAGIPTRLACLGLGCIWRVPRPRKGLSGCAHLLLSLTELCMREPGADAYLLAPAGAILSPGLREHLQRHLWPSADTGAIVLQPASQQAPAPGTGFTRESTAVPMAATSALILPRDVVHAFLTDSKVVVFCLEEAGREQTTDPANLVKEWCQRTGRAFWLHYFKPLARHT